MIEKTVIGYLDGLDGLPAYAERPENPPDEYLIIEKVGGGKDNRIDRATIAVQSYAGSLFRAAEICGKVERAMEEITDLETISKCKLNTSYNYTDTESKKYRYQAVFDLVYMEGEEEYG